MGNLDALFGDFNLQDECIQCGRKRNGWGWRTSYETEMDGGNHVEGATRQEVGDTGIVIDRFEQYGESTSHKVVSDREHDHLEQVKPNDADKVKAQNTWLDSVVKKVRKGEPKGWLARRRRIHSTAGER